MVLLGFTRLVLSLPPKNTTFSYCDLHKPHVAAGGAHCPLELTCFMPLPHRRRRSVRLMRCAGMVHAPHGTLYTLLTGCVIWSRALHNASAGCRVITLDTLFDRNEFKANYVYFPSMPAVHILCNRGIDRDPRVGLQSMWIARRMLFERSGR